MMRYNRLQHEFVHYIPEKLHPGVLYVSVDYATTVHSCCCGCGMEVVTPLTPSDWKLIFDGETVSLSPSIGNWKFPCRSHYVVERGRVIEAKPREVKKGGPGDCTDLPSQPGRRNTAKGVGVGPQSCGDGSGLWSWIRRKLERKRQ